MGCSEFDFQVSTCTQVDIGFDFDKVLTYSDNLGVAIDLSSLDFAMTIKDSLGGSVLLNMVEVGTNLLTGIHIPLPLTGVLNLQITDTDTSLISEGSYPYEIVSTDGDGKKQVFMQGTIQFSSRGF